MDLFAKETNVKRSKKYHREIYLNNENRVSKDKLKTILRYPIE